MKLLVATFFLSGVLSAPFTNQLNRPAALECNRDASHFHTKKSLVYSYEGETITGLVGTSEVRSGLKLTAKCQITPVQPCLYMLQILEAKLLEGQGKNPDALDFKLSSGSVDLSRELTARDLYFESHEGVITNIRPQEGEPVHVLNMKRGILSSFQLKLVKKDHTLTEVDVNGECSANYHIKARHVSGRVKTVVKRKDLSLCKDRSETNLGIPVTSYPTDKPFNILKSNSLCKYALTHLQRIGKVSCEETHLFRPFSAGYNSSSGAMTTVRQTIQMTGRAVSRDEKPSIPGTEQVSLKYDHKKNPESSTNNYKEVERILDKLGAEEGAKPDTARLFTKLIFALRRVNSKTLRYVWWKYYDCLPKGKCTNERSERYQKYIVDALSQCGTLECAEYMVSTITNKQVGTPQSVAFLTGIALTGKPSENMVGNILDFCERTPSRTAFLTLGTLMHKYCSQHSCDSLNSLSPIYKADKFLQGKLLQNCQTSSPEELESITLALKAIGNAGRPYTSVQNILKCAIHPGPSFVNVDAIQALRRMPCADDMTKGLLNIFDDLTMDTEIRIETYLALVRCPSQTVIQKIADVLDTEKNNQVGSFVWSHLTNALESTEPVYGVPLREAISKALQERNLRQFKLDHLRYSHAYEASYYNKKYEVGGSSQAQVVFHPNSYFPRSAKFNFTVDVLGASVNLLETAARFEGFETLMEQMFGSDGYFPDERLMQLLKIKPTDASGRRRRSAAEEEMNEIKTNLEKLQDKMQIERKNPTGALSLKVFGHELQFMSIEDIDWLQGEADSINVIDTLINIARGGKVTYTKSFFLLEADHEIPTGLGFPLKLAVNGSAVSSVTLKGKFDIRNMFWGKKKLDVRGFVSPSATIDISGKMTVDATHASSGINVNSSLYTSTEINGNVTYKEGEGIKLSVEPPTKPVYIINVKSNLATFLNERREKISGSPRRFEHKNCANFTRFLGVQLCGHVSLPMAYRDYNAPYFPLSGESSFGMVFHTTNPNLARFELEGRKLTSEDENRYDWIFNVHVPGLTFGRKVVGNSTFQFLEDGKYLSVSFGIHDYKFGKFEAKYNNVTNRLHTKFSTPTMAYLKPITIQTEIFNSRNNETKAQDIGIAINASYSNFTIQDVLSFHKRKDQYGFKSKFTYWPKKSITTEARFSLQKKHMYIKMDDSGSTNRFYFGGKLGKSSNRFYAKIGNDLMNYEIKMNGELNLNAKKVLASMMTKPSGNVIKFEAYPRWNALENGYYMRLSNVNSSSYVTGYLGSSNLKRESTLKFNGMIMKKPFLFHTSHYVLSSGRRVEWIARGFGNNANASIEYSAKRWSKMNLEFSAALNDKTIKNGVFLKQGGIGAYFVGLNKTMNFDVDYLNEGQSRGFSVSLEMDGHTQNSKKIKAQVEYAGGDEEKDIKFSIKGLGYSSNLIWSYYSYDNETGLKMNAYVSNKNSVKRVQLLTGLFREGVEKGLRVKADVLDKEFEARWSILTGDNSGMKFAAQYMNTQLSLQSTFRSDDNLKVWRVDTTYADKTTSLISTYRSHDRYLCSEIAGLSAGRLEACLQLVSNDREIALRLVGEVLGRRAEMKVGWIHKNESRGIVLKMTYNSLKVSDFFVGLVKLPSYTGLSFKGTVKEKSVEALLKYKNTPLKRSLDLDLHVQGKLVTFESMLVCESTLQGAQINMIYESKQIGSLFALLHKKSSSNVFKIGGKAMNYGAEYKLALGSSNLERTLSSMVIFTAHSKHYKYGYSISHSNLGTLRQFNHVITTKLHYAKGKILTSTYKFVNSEQKFNLLSKMELAPGQFITNKLTYYKQHRLLLIKYEMLPGIGMTYLAGFINDNQRMGIQSNLTVMDDYPMHSFVMLNKQNGLLTGQLSYLPKLSPIEFTTHLRRNNGIDFGFILSALGQIWKSSILMDYPLNNQFVFNITTSSAFSVELAATTLTKDVYTLVLKHEYKDTVFEDLVISISSLQHLNKLRLGWESKSGREFLKNLNITMQKLLDGSLASLANSSVSARKMAFDILKYIRNDGREKFMAAFNKSKAKIIYLKELLRDLDVNKTIEKYFVHADEILKKVKSELLQLVDELKSYGVSLMDTYNYMEQMIKEISSELLPYTKSFTLDVKKWISRTVNRYLGISICGITVKDILGMITNRTQLYYTIIKESILKQVETFKRKYQEITSVLKEVEDFAEKAKTTVENFTCNYNLECTKRNVQVELKKFANCISQYKIGRVLERLNKTIEQLTQKYKKIESYILLIVKENHLQERAMKVLEPVIDFLTTVTYNLKLKVITLRKKVKNIMKRSDLMVFYNNTKAHYNELLKDVEKAKNFTTNNFELAKKYLFERVGEVKESLQTIKADTLIAYQMLVKLIDELKEMSWEEMQVYAKNEVEINYQKLKDKLVGLRATVMESVKFCLKSHKNEIEQLKELGNTIYTTCDDIINGRTSVQDAKTKVELLLKKLMGYLKDQKLRVMDKINDLKLEQTAKKTYRSAMELYRKTTQNLKMKVTALYPKVIEELKNVLLKIKNVAVKYVELAKVHFMQLRDMQMINLKKALAKLQETKETLMRKAYEILHEGKILTLVFIMNLELDVIKLMEKYQSKLNEAIVEYKANLKTAAEKLKTEIMNTFKLYQNVPIENIYADLKLKANQTFDLLLGFIIGNSLISYKEALEKVKMIKELYRNNREVVEAMWNNITDVFQELYQKYRPLVTKKYIEVLDYLLENIQPTRITTEIISALKDFGRKIMSVTEVRFEQLKLWYEHVKYMKFKELYYNIKNLLEKWDFSLKNCCEKLIKEWRKEFDKMKAKLQYYIHEVREESKNVIRRIEEVNEDVKRDTIETFGPYEKRVRNVLHKHMTKTLKKLAPFNQNYEKIFTLLAEYRNTTEEYVRRRHQDIMDLDQDEIMDMVNASFKRYPFLMELKNYSEHYVTQIIEYLNRWPFLYRVRTHKIWPILMQEFLDHEIVTGFQELGKASVNKIKELSIDYYSRSLLKISELRDDACVKLEQFKNNIFLQNEKIKKTIKDKREDINLELRGTHAKLRSKGEQLVEEANEMYELGYKKLEEAAKRIGEVSIHDVESRVRQYFRSLLAPVKAAYVDLSDFVVAKLLILDKYQRELQKRVRPLRRSLMNVTNDIRNRFEDMSTKVKEWGTRAWIKSKSELGRVEMLSAKVLVHLENVTAASIAAGQRLIDDYVPYKDLLTMTPNQLIERVDDIPLKAEKLFKLVQGKTERLLHSSMQMFKELKDSVSPEKIQEMREKAELLLNNTRGQMHFLATEILETTVFVTKFYGSPDTVYSAHPEMVKFADYQLRRFINCSRICKAKAMKYYNETRDFVAKIYAKVNYTYHNKLPQLVKYIRTEFKDLNMESLRKLHKMAKIYFEMSKEYVMVKYSQSLEYLELSSLKLKEYLKSMQSKVTLKLNVAKEQLEKFLKTEAGKKFNEMYKKLLVAFEDVKEMIRSQYGEILVYSRNLTEQCKSYMTTYFNADIISDFPILVKNAIGRLPLILDMVKRDLKTLMNDTVEKLREGKLYIQDEVFPKVKQSYMSNVNTLKKHLLHLKKTTSDVMHSVNKDIKEELPLIKELILNIVNIIRHTEIALISGELELKHPPVDELSKILSDLNTTITKKYEIVYPKLDKLYQDSKKTSMEILERVTKDSKETLKYIREKVPKFCETKFTELRELAEPKLKSLSSSAAMALKELKRMRKEVQDFCEEKGLIFFNKSIETKQMVLDYVKMLFENSKSMMEYMKKQLSGLTFETRLNIEQLRNQVMKMNNDLLETVKQNRKELEKKVMTYYNSNEIRKFVNKYIDVEDLMNKTIEIKEDILNMTLVQDLVQFGEMCYAEGRRLYNLSKESSEFAMYVMKRVVKYSDVWEIVEELTNPFHWFPPSNSIAMIFGKPHVYTFDGQSYQFIGYKKPSCTYVLAHDFRDNNFTLMSQETALIVNTKSGFIKIHQSGKIEATVSKDADGKEIKTTHTELPVEMMQMSVRREGSFIKVKHDTGLHVVCDLRHFLCTFNIDKFYHGKLAGLLGTNNNEQYDEFLKPDKTIAKSIAEFANAWEVSGDPECKVSGTMEQLKPSCEKKPSPRCEELFLSSSSPLASYFKTVDPKPFYDACVFDTSDCKANVPQNESFCNVTAAYTALLRQKGVWARQLHECASCGSKGVWRTWTERGSKNVDVVLLIPETLNLQTHADNLPSFLKELDTDLSKYKPRYAVVGFGGKTALLRRPHIVTSGGKIFGGINDVQSAIANMKFTTEKANAFEAIEYLAHLPFLSGASKVVIMIEDQNHEAVSSAPLQQAIKELEMQGVIFNVIGPYFQKKQHKDVIGLWKDQAMMRKDKTHSKFKKIGLPSNNNIRLAESSQGGIFNLKAYSKTHGDWSNLLKRAMKRTIVKQIDEDQTYCRQCVCIPGLTAEPVTICRINRHSRCS